MKFNHEDPDFIKSLKLKDKDADKIEDIVVSSIKAYITSYQPSRTIEDIYKKIKKENSLILACAFWWLIHSSATQFSLLLKPMPSYIKKEDLN